MYNPYIDHTGPRGGGPCPPPPPPPPKTGILGSLSQGLGDRLNSLQLDTDTIIAIIAIWFLLSDHDEFDTDLLIVIGVLLLLGI